MEIDIEQQLNRFRAIRDTKAKPLTQRNEVIKKFVDRLNADRRKVGFKELSPRFYAIKMAQSGLKSVWDLEWFYAYCDDAQNFSSTWWWSLKA